MAKEVLKSASAQAGLSPRELDQINGLSKMLEQHRRLSGMPSQIAQQEFAKLPQEQQNAHLAMFGDEDPIPAKKRGWLGTAFHYLTEGLKNTVAVPFRVANEASDFMTRIYRTGAIAATQNVDLAKAFEIANDKGDKVFNPGRIEKAKAKFGSDLTAVAVKVAQGIPIDQIQAEGTEAEKQILAKYYSDRNKPDGLMQDALDAVQAAKYSPGRQLANLLLPEGMEGSGFLYKGIAGVTDAAYRIFTDPTLVLGKAKKAYDAGDWILFNVIGKPKGSYGRALNQIALNPQNVDRYFSDPRAVNLWNQYGEGLKRLEQARLGDNPLAGSEARTFLKRLAPEYGDQTINQLLNAGVRDAATARNFLQNQVDARNILRGTAARKSPLLPILDAPRKARIAVLTTGNKVLSFNEVGKEITETLYGVTPGYEDIATGIGTRAEDIAYMERDLGKIRKSNGAWRLSTRELQGRIDRFSRKFNLIPNFKDRSFNVMAPDAPKDIYRLAALGISRYHANVISEVFSASDEGTRRKIFTTLWNTVANVRNVDKTEFGSVYMAQQAGEGLVQEYAADIVVDGINKGNPAFIDALGKKVGLTDADLSTNIAVPSLQDLDVNTARVGLFKYLIGGSLKRPVRRITDYWVFGTLAGPRTVVRNASEDAIMHLSIGESPFGLTKSRLLNTKFNQIREGMLKLSQAEVIAAKEIKDLETQIASAADDATKSALSMTLKERQTAFKELEGKKLSWSESKLGFINKVVRRSQTDRYRKELALAIAEGKDPVEASRRVLASAVNDTKLGFLIPEQDRKYFDLLAKHGPLEDYVDDVTQGGTSYAQNADYIVAAKRDISEYNDVAEFSVDGKRYAQANGLNNYGQFDPVVSDANRISWMMQIGRLANSPLDRVAIANLSNAGDDKAIDAVLEAIKKLTTQQRARFELNGVISDEEWASKIVARAKNYFVKRDGKTLNDDLLNKVRFTTEDGATKVTSEFLRLEDMPGIGNPELAPQWISGKVLMPVSGTDNFGASIMEKTYDYMAEANGRFTRQNVVTYEATRVLKEMDESGFTKRAQDLVMQGKTAEEAAQAWEYTQERLVELALETARERTLAYVDNPALRSQLAFTSRNLARFFRATEDFYRRVYRTVRYNPEAISRLSLTYEGIAHSGWVQQDDNGEDYFFYPGLNPVYQTMSRVFDRFGIKNGFQIPMPVEFSAKLKMITPSMNPDSLFPTFAGPVAALPMKAVFALFPSLQKLETAVLGQYGEDQPLINAVLPAHVQRALATLSRDERNSQYASAFRKAATYAEAAGYAPKVKIDPVTGEELPPSEGELENYRQVLESATITVLGLRFVTGFFLPAPSTITLKDDMAKWARDNGRVNMKQVFNNLIQQYGSIDKAAEEWIRLYPKEIPYMISESESNTVASVRAVDSAANWIDQNKGVLSAYPQGGAFLIPQEGDFDFDAYRILSKSGLRQSKTLSDFMLELQTSTDIKTYYKFKDQYDQQLAATPSIEGKRMLREQWSQWSDQFFGARPLVKQQFIRQTERKFEKMRALEDLTNMVNDPEVTTQPKTKAILKKMVDAYSAYERKKNTFAGNGETQQNMRDLLRSQIKEQLEQIAGTNRNAQSAYTILFSSLIGE